MVDRNALNLRWTFGFNVDGAAGTLVDLTADGRQVSPSVGSVLQKVWIHGRAGTARHPGMMPPEREREKEGRGRKRERE